MSIESSDLSKRNDIKNYLKRYADGKYRNSVVEFLPDSGTHLIVVEGGITPFTSKARIMLERRVFKDLKLTVLVSQLSKKVDDITAAALLQIIEPLLLKNLIDVCVSVSDGGGVEVIVFVHNVKSAQDTRDTIFSKIEDFFKGYDIEVDRCFINELAEGAPTFFQILRVIYTFAPIAIPDLEIRLLEEQIPSTSNRWLKRQLDHLVRENLVMWQKPGNFVLTAAGLGMLPKRQDRGSPDLKRALALARRKW